MDEGRKRIVAFYARVSTEHEEQVSAFKNQLEWYEELLKQHPEWEKYKIYSDKGITGTSIQKRPGFLEMISDAKNHCFDLIVTREVSRFARNTVDTLSMTRELKKIGVEIFFVNDGIWSFNPESDLVLSVMATMAESESKKISQRASSGQAISRKKGVYYGNGNILGYKRIETKEAGKPKEVSYVIDEEQALTVRKIYDLYLAGKGIKAIQYELENLGYKTATGLSHWNAATIARILKNSFYTGKIQYRTQWTPDYLEQKKINNIGDMPFEYAEGTHTPIVTKEEFDKVQEILQSHSTENKNLPKDECGKILPTVQKRQRFFGKRPPVDVWSALLVCECGCKFNRHNWHKDDEGNVQHSYQCYSQKETGTVKTRENHGLSTEGICRSPMVPEWQLQLMVDKIFTDFLHNGKKRAYLLNELTKKLKEPKKKKDDVLEKIDAIDKQIIKLNIRLSGFQSMCADGDITREEYRKYANEISVLLQELKKQKSELMPSPESINSAEKRADDIFEWLSKQNFKLDVLGEIALEPSAVYAFVEKIVVHEKYFEWYLRFDPDDDPTKCLVSGNKRRGSKPIKFEYSGEDLNPPLDYSSPGGDQRRQIIRSIAKIKQTKAGIVFRQYPLFERKYHVSRHRISRK